MTKRAILPLFFSLLLGCGGPPSASHSTPDPLSGGGLDHVTGPQQVRFVLVAYQDTPEPAYDPNQLALAADTLDQIVRRNSGAPPIGTDINQPGAWVVPSFAHVTLPGPQSLYSQTSYEDLISQPPTGPLVLDCLQASPSQYIDLPIRIFLTPTSPKIDLGYAAVAAGFCSDVNLGNGIFGCPVPHEFGHTLGMVHDDGKGFIMYPDSVAHWDQDYSPLSRSRVSWP